MLFYHRSYKGSHFISTYCRFRISPLGLKDDLSARRASPYAVYSAVTDSSRAFQPETKTLIECPDCNPFKLVWLFSIEGGYPVLRSRFLQGFFLNSFFDIFYRLPRFIMQPAEKIESVTVFLSALGYDALTCRFAAALLRQDPFQQGPKLTLVPDASPHQKIRPKLPRIQDRRQLILPGL